MQYSTESVTAQYLQNELTCNNFLMAIEKSIRRTLRIDGVETCFDVQKKVLSDETYYSGVIRVGSRRSVRSHIDMAYAMWIYEKEKSRSPKNGDSLSADFFEYCKNKDLLYMLYFSSNRYRTINPRLHYTFFDFHTHPSRKLSPSSTDLHTLNKIRRARFDGKTRPVGIVAGVFGERKGIPILFYQENNPAPNTESQRRNGQKFLEYCSSNKDNSARNKVSRMGRHFGYNSFYAYFNLESRTFDSLCGLKDFSFEFPIDGNKEGSGSKGIYESVEFGQEVLNFQLNLMLT